MSGCSSWHGMAWHGSDALLNLCASSSPTEVETGALGRGASTIARRKTVDYVHLRGVLAGIGRLLHLRTHWMGLLR